MFDLMFDMCGKTGFLTYCKTLSLGKPSNENCLHHVLKPENSHLPYQRVKTVEVKKSYGKLKKLKIEKAKTELAPALQSDQKELET